MKIQDILWLSFKDLNEKKVRTALTVVMVVIGIAAIVALTSLTAGISQSISGSLSSLGPTSIIVTSSSATGFTVADLDSVLSLPNVTSVTPFLTGDANLYSGNQNISVTLIGTTSAGLKQILGGNTTLYQGSIYQDTIAPAAVIGHSVAFPASQSGAQVITVGEPATLKIGGRDGETITVPVIGILTSHSSFIIPINTGVFLSLSSAELLLHRTSFDGMLVLASNTSSVNSTAALITTIYGSKASVLTTSSILSTVAQITGDLGLLFGAIAGVSLLVAAIGIMNIMLIAVYERTHEIGIMKSVGFKNRQVMLVFLFQALIIGVIGGLIGIGLGAGASYSLSAVLSAGSTRAGSSNSTAAPTTGAGGGGARAGGGGARVSGGLGGGSASGSGSASSLSFTPVFPVSTILTALIIAIIVSVLAGIYPAWRASKMEPIDALRSL
jgi:putative ABC transport system permease protein